MGELKEDKYRDHIYGEGEANTVWKYGTPPNYDAVNKLFEEGRTHVSFISSTYTHTHTHIS